MNTIIGIYFVFFLMDSVIAKSADAEAIIFRHLPKDKSQETEQADSDNVRYQHLSIDDSQGTVVDKIIGLEEEESEDSDIGNLRNEIQRLKREHQTDRYGEIFEPVHEKANNLGSDQVRHEPGCTVTEKS